MKVIFDGPVPFQFAHGGAQFQVEQTMAALKKKGIGAEPLRWWDSEQKADIVHYYGIPSDSLIRMAAMKGVPTVSTTLFSGSCNHPETRLKLHGFLRKMAMTLPGSGLLVRQTTLAAYSLVTRFMVGLDVEVNVLTTVFGVPRDRITKVPLGLDNEFLQMGAPKRDADYLITTGTITKVKRSVELARMALKARVPLMFVGKPYSATDPYWLEFKSLIDSKYVIYQRHVESREEMIDLLQSARGFVLRSLYENWCLSAHEAVACGLPVLVQDQPWSREVFGNGAQYLLNQSSPDNPALLKKFYDQAPNLSAPNIRIWSWDEVAEQLIGIYEEVLSAR